MVKEMLINVSEGEECRIALVEDGRLEELYMERTSATSHVGNIYKGRVTNVEASIQAAFIDFGLGRNGFLHISDLMPTYFGGDAEDVQESVGRKMARRDRPPIQRCLRRGDEIVVQIIKEGIGTKGPTLSTYLAIPGRIIVMMPGMARMGVSRKIEDEGERRRLRQILDSLEPPQDVGFIIRTAGVGKTKAEIQRDLTYLTRLWQGFVKKRDSGPGPMELYTEGDLVSRTVRDVFTSDVERIVVDHKEVAKRIKEVVKLANPRTRNKVEYYEEPIPLFHKYGIESQIEQMHSRHVPLPSGGSLVIDSTEAIVAIDVNSGKFRDHSDAETTAFKTDMEAADEIPRQLRLRDLGGVIICDFIDLRYERHRRDLEQLLHDRFANDRAKTRVLRMSQFGIIEITRQRMRPSLKRSIYFDCPHCKGAGLVKTPESMSLDAMRRLAIAANDARVTRVEMSICPDVALHLQNRKRQSIAELEARCGKRILIKPDAKLALDEVKLELFDNREGMVYLSDLGMTPALPPGAEPSQRGRGGRRDDRGGRRGPPPQQRGPSGPPPQQRRDQEEDSHSIDRVEQEVEDREEEIESPSGDSLDAHVMPISEGNRPGYGGDAPERDMPRGNQSRGNMPGGNMPGGNGPMEGEQGTGRRRRRRRGRRGRGGGGGNRTEGNQSTNGNFRQDQPHGGPVRNQPYDEQDQYREPDQEHDGESEPVHEREPDGELAHEGEAGHEHEPVIGRSPEMDRRPAMKSASGERPEPMADGNNPGPDGAPRRRRRRRGGRGRGRNRGANQQQPMGDGPRGDDPHDDDAHGNGPQAKLPVEEFEPDPLPPQITDPPPVPERAAPRRRAGAAPRPRRKPPAAAPTPPAKPVVKAPIVSGPVVRTGSADKHLARDEPVAPQPLSRPHSARDLDYIPDDFD